MAAAMVFSGASLLAGAPLLAQADPAAIAATPSSSTSNVKSLLTEGRFSEALAEASALRNANPADFEASYYVAMAQLGLGNLDAALAAAQQAQNVAPADSRQAVDTLIGTINAQRGSGAGSGALAEAEVALADGLVGKAARLYDEAWAGGRGDPEAALKAAGLYADRLGQFADAGRLLNDVVRAYPESPSANKAKAEYTKHAAAMANARSSLVVRAWGESWPSVEKTLLAASSIEPRNEALHYIRLAKAAEAGDSGGARRAIIDIAKIGPVNIVSLSVLPGMSALTKDAEFSQFLLDVLGNGRHATLVASVDKNLSTETLAKLVAQKAVSVSIRSGCDAARSFCTYTANYPIVSIGGSNKCNPQYNLGSPTKNQYSDLLSSYAYKLNEVNGLAKYAPSPYRTKYLLELSLESDPTASFSRGFLVDSDQTANALAIQLNALRISCGNLKWATDITARFDQAAVQSSQTR